MSRSYRKTKIFGVAKDAHGSDKEGKKICNGILRARARQELKTCKDWDNFVPVNKKEAYDVWNLPSDGKYYWRGADAKSMRK